MSQSIGKRLVPAAIAIAMLGVIGIFGGNAKTAEAFLPGDICAAYVGNAEKKLEAIADFDGQGNSVYVVNQDEKYGLVFRVQDIMAAWLVDLKYDRGGPARDSTGAPLPDPYAYSEDWDLTLGGVLPGPNVHVEIDSETGSARITSQAQAYSFDTRDDVTIGTYRVGDLWLVPDVTHVLINPGVLSQLTQSFSPRWFNNSSGFALDNINTWLASHAGMYGFADSATSVCGATGCSAFDGIYAERVLDESYGTGNDNPLPGTPTWTRARETLDVAAGTVYSCDDSWGYIDFTCIESGYFHIDMRTSDIAWGLVNDHLLPLIEEAIEDFEDVNPLGVFAFKDFFDANTILEYIFYWNLDPARTGLSLKFFCKGEVDSATISATPTTVETNPVGTFKSSSIITVTAYDQDGARIDLAEVTFTTDNCRFSNPQSTNADDQGMTPAGGGTTVTMWTDTDSTADKGFLTDNPLQTSAGTAEVSLDCATGTPGKATVTAIVDRRGADIVLKQEITVVGPTAVTGLTLTLTPDELECGETLIASATAVDSEGQKVSNGTLIFFTTDTSSGIVGGTEGAQGGVATVDGEATVHIATDPGNPGIHTVIAYALRGTVAEDVVAQVSATYECEGAVAPAAPTVAPPSTGTGTGSITPPNTGDAGLASGNSSFSLFAIAGVVAFFLAGLASVRFARN